MPLETVYISQQKWSFLVRFLSFPHPPPSSAYGGHCYKDVLLTLPGLDILDLEKNKMVTIFLFHTILLYRRTGNCRGPDLSFFVCMFSFHLFLSYSACWLLLGFSAMTLKIDTSSPATLLCLWPQLPFQYNIYWHCFVKALTTHYLNSGKHLRLFRQSQHRNYIFSSEAHHCLGVPNWNFGASHQHQGIAFAILALSILSTCFSSHLWYRELSGADKCVLHTRLTKRSIVSTAEFNSVHWDSSPCCAYNGIEFSSHAETYGFVLKDAEVKLNRILSLERTEATP